jgi:gluconokinase
LGWNFYNADDYHPPQNIARMARGIPLNDSHRVPCSALKERYRQQLLNGNPAAHIVYPKDTDDLICSHMSKRSDHYMKLQILQSQFDTLEEPDNALTVAASKPLTEIVQELVKYLKE